MNPDTREKVQELFRKMETFYLANKSDNLYFAVLGDCSEGNKQEEEFDKEVIDEGIKQVEKLNEKYGKQGFPIFHFIYRERQYNNSEEKFLGWERKRGLLTQFNEYILKHEKNKFKINTINQDELPKIKYVITLDSDTDLVLNTAFELIGAMAHILNRPEVKNGIVVKGHALMQPRIGINLDISNKNIFTKIFIKNIPLFFIEILSAYIATKVLVLGNTKISQAIDALFNNTISEYINKQFWIYVAVLVASGFIFTYIQTYATKVFAVNMQTDFRREAGKKLPELQFKYFDSHLSARVLNNFIDDVAKISEYYSELLPDIVKTIITSVTIFITLIKVDRVMALLLLVIIPVMAVITSFTGNMVSKLTRKHTEYNDEVNELAYDAINGISVVKSFNLENYFKNKIKNTLKTILKFEYRRNAISSIGWATGSLVSTAPYIILSIFALHRVLSGNLTVGGMTYFILFMDRLLQPLGNLPYMIIDAKIDLVSKNRLKELMNYPVETNMENSEDNTGDFSKKSDNTGKNSNIVNADKIGKNNNAAVVFKDVTFSYVKGNNVLKNFNVNIEAGKNVAFVGSSGGGKSTIFKLICGLYEVNGGTVEIFGKRIGEENIDLIRKDIALVSQDTYLFPETIAWNVACGDESVSMERIIECCKKARIHDDIMKMPQGYNTDAGERGNMLSGGQKQRIAIARALLKDARLILFDEPTASVDIENEEKIKQAIEEIKENHTIITIAHRLNTIENADCIYVVDNGVIAESGTHDELIAVNGIYKRLYDTKDEVSYE
mgnify:CR=1 FL=1